jgi:hypothetical protein
MVGCAYNQAKGCHAQAINVGGKHAMCDTFTQAAGKGGDPDKVGSVGACKVDGCAFNRSLECTAGSIQVGPHSDHADCRTYMAK